MRTPIVAGNWKMNGSRAMARSLAAALVKEDPAGTGVAIVLCPPATLISTVSGAVESSGIETGCQDIDPRDDGAFTGQISAALATDAGARFAIIGHSERRALFGESDELIAEKTQAALAADLTPILCVGETREERESGDTMNVVNRQLDAVVELVGIAAFERIVIAYEPVWAIGTGLTASPDQAQQVHAHLRARLSASDSDIAARCRIIYGGSMKPDNAEALISQPDIDGGLIGGASLDAESFVAICRAASPD